jgi:hypothetical protein
MRLSSPWPRHEPLDFGLGQILSGPQLGVGRLFGGNCSFYGGWRDQPQVRFGHVFRPVRVPDCS